MVTYSFTYLSNNEKMYIPRVCTYNVKYTVLCVHEGLLNLTLTLKYTCILPKRNCIVSKRNCGCTAQARATPSWLTHNKCCPHSLLPGIEYSRHVTPWAISRAPHYRLKSIKVFSVITSRTLLKKGMLTAKYMTFLKIIHTSMTR